MSGCQHARNPDCRHHSEAVWKLIRANKFEEALQVHGKTYDVLNRQDRTVREVICLAALGRYAEARVRVASFYLFVGKTYPRVPELDAMHDALSDNFWPADFVRKQAAKMMPEQPQATSIVTRPDLAALKVLIDEYAGKTQRVRYGIFAGQLPRNFRELKRLQLDTQIGKIPSHLGIEAMLKIAVHLGSHHPIYLELLRCLSNCPIGEIQAMPAIRMRDQ